MEIKSRMSNISPESKNPPPQALHDIMETTIKQLVEVAQDRGLDEKHRKQVEDELVGSYKSAHDELDRLTKSQ